VEMAAATGLLCELMICRSSATFGAFMPPGSITGSAHGTYRHDQTRHYQGHSENRSRQADQRVSIGLVGTHRLHRISPN
jgi:hypothetical protein